MKRYSKLCFFSLLLIALSGCKKDDDPQINGSLVGQWRLTDAHSDNGISETMFLGQTFTTTYTFHGTDYNAITVFTENPNEFVSTGDYTVISAATTMGQTVRDTTVADVFAGTGTWSINGDMLTQVFAGETTTFEILELSADKLRLKDELDVTFVDSLIGVTIRDRATVYSSFKRQ